MWIGPSAFFTIFVGTTRNSPSLISCVKTKRTSMHAPLRVANRQKQLRRRGMLQRVSQRRA
jgi:hypothetical protein